MKDECDGSNAVTAFKEIAIKEMDIDISASALVEATEDRSINRLRVCDTGEPPLKQQKGNDGVSILHSCVSQNGIPPSFETLSADTNKNQDSNGLVEEIHSSNLDEEEEQEDRRRPRRAAARFARIAAQPFVTRTKKTSTKKSTQEDTEEEFKTAWICCECKEAECMMHPDADQLLICEGSCRRLFHAPCAGLTKPPDAEESYVCQDCQKGRHICSFCHIYGIDNEDVFRCCVAKCGLFFHEACLQMHDVEVTLTSPRTSTIDASLLVVNQHDTHRLIRQFKCPSHACATCCQKDMVEKEKKLAAEVKKTETHTKKKGRKKSSKSSGSAWFGQKTNQTIIKCLVCPNAYHVTCIPPTARFNELSLLCPDHVANNKLPDIDPENSLQASIEKKIDAKFAESESFSRRRDTKRNRKNPFFHGLEGKALSPTELEMVRLFGMDSQDYLMDTFSYCLPCNIRDEVYAKPPAYRHIHTLKYNPQNCPKPLKESGERCSCIDVCDDSCINRILYVECRLEKGNKGSNCALGKSCGNRQIGQRMFKKCLPKREQGKGWGLVLQQDVRKGDLLIEYIGEVINEEQKGERLKDWAKEHPNDPNFYVMGLGKGWYVDARNEANLSRFINHSCSPNSVVHTINVGGFMRNGIFALRDIPAGTFLSYDYHFETMQGERFVCRCGAKNCRGTMKDGNASHDDAAEKSSREVWEAAQRDYERDKAFVDDFYARRIERQSRVGATVPGAEFPSDLVSNGPLQRHRHEAIRGRIFLWRNSRLGADFDKRFAKFAA